MDFMSLPPKARTEDALGDYVFDTLWVIVDRLSKYVKLIPLHKNITSRGLISLFYFFIYIDWHMPFDIVSNLGPKFTSQEF